MFDFLSKLLPGQGKTLRVEGFWFAKPIRLPKPILTPFHSRVTVVCPCVDVDYHVKDGQILVDRVAMSQAGTTMLGSSLRINMTAERTGEAFYVHAISPHSLLTDAVNRDVQDPRGNLRRIMYGKWRDTCRSDVGPAMIDALNQQLSAEQIRQLIGNAGVLGAVALTYESPKRGPEERVVTVHSVQGDSIQATDHKDGLTKTFRIDRISNVRPAGQ